jgi:twitching motility protein PilT
MPMNILNIFKQAIDLRASDVHLTVGHPPIFRVDGELVRGEGAPIDGKDLEAALWKVLTPEQRERFEAERDLDFSTNTDGSRFRVNLSYERGNVALVARLIPSVIPSFKDLNIPDVMADIITRSDGLILVTGPTGCGKSTALASMIERINNERTVAIVTLEDPIEFMFQSKKALIRQRELGGDMRSFADGLKHVLRQDPNVIMVGEMRDPETIAATLTLAETGHLVLSTLHTPSAAQAVDRIVDSFPPHQQTQIRSQLALSLRAVMSQKLLPALAGGRIAVREVLLNVPAVGNLIRENKIAQIPNVMQTHASAGMFNFGQALRDLVQRRLISKAVADAFRPPEED